MGDSKYEKIFKRNFAHRDEDEVNVIKTQAIALPDRRAMFLIMFSKLGKANEKEGFVKTIVRIGSMKNWIQMIEDCSNKNPAEQIRLSDLDYGEIEGCDYKLYLNKTHATKSYFKKFFRNRFTKALHYTDFLEKIRIQNIYKQHFIYPLVYDGLDISKDLYKMEEGKWYTNTIVTYKKGRQRAKSKVIM